VAFAIRVAELGFLDHLVLKGFKPFLSPSANFLEAVTKTSFCSTGWIASLIHISVYFADWAVLILDDDIFDIDSTLFVDILHIP